jgi:hypothetical protein
MPLDPRTMIFIAWIAFLIVWILVAGWSARTASHDDLGAESPSRVLTLAAIVMLLVAYRPQGLGVVWVTPQAFGWPLFALLIVGFAFAFWGRLHLGSLWSNAVSPTEAHRIVNSGPYGVVRPPARCQRRRLHALPRPRAYADPGAQRLSWGRKVAAGHRAHGCLQWTIIAMIAVLAALHII